MNDARAEVVSYPPGGPGQSLPDRRRGVAIILVLGILALMMLLGVAFSITMRVERTGAGNFSNRVNTRHLVNATLARALEAIDLSMAMDRASTNHLYPAWHVLPSAGAGDVVRLGWGRGLGYVQGALTNEAMDAWSTWLDLALDEGVKGRGAFLVINESGFVDANRAAGVWTRAAGSTPGELDVSGFPSVLNATNLVATRTFDTRYETLQEFALLQEDDGSGGNGLRRGHRPDYFSVYSRAPRGVLQDDFSVSTNLVYLGDHWANWTNVTRRGEIVAALTRSGIDPAEAPFVYTNLLDYADEDSVPRDLNAPCTEPVPMINEAMFRARVVRVDTATVEIPPGFAVIELFYPFVQASTHSFTITGTVEAVVMRTDGGSPVELFRSVPPASFSVPSGYVPRPAGSPTGGETCNYRSVSARTPLCAFAAPSNAVMQVTMNIRAVVIVNEPSGVSPVYPALTAVDAVTNTPMAIAVGGIRLEAPGSIVIASQSIEAYDPRFNADCDAATTRRYWAANRDGTNSIPAENSVTTWYLDAGRALRTRGIDWDTKMHVSNLGQLASPGELGFLIRGPTSRDRFRTIRLFDWDAATLRDRVLEHVTTDDAAVSRGRVNLNTAHAAVLEAVWRGIPIDFPESGRSMVVTNAAALVSGVHVWRGATNAFENVADIGALDWRRLPGFGTKSDLEIESMIAHTCGLLTTRHNLFTILLSARPFSMGLGTVADRAGEGDWMGAERAVAQVWRDPFPNADGRHRYVVQYFRWLGAD